MVKLQKRFAYKYKDKPHFKHVITVPEDILERLGWSEGTELEPQIDGHSLVIRPKGRSGKHGKKQ